MVVCLFMILVTFCFFIGEKIQNIPDTPPVQTRIEVTENHIVDGIRITIFKDKETGLEYVSSSSGTLTLLGSPK